MWAIGFLSFICWCVNYDFRYINKPPGDVGLYDPAEIHNRSLLKFFLKESMVKLGFHLVFFFLYLYRSV